jgi:hypothetical protein
MDDLGRRAAAGRLDAGERPQILQHRRGFAFRQAAEQRREPVAARRRGVIGGRGVGQQLVQPARRGEGALDPRRQRLGEAQAVDEGAEEGDVAQMQRQVLAPAGGGRAPGQPGDFGVGLGRRGGLERLQADLQELLVGLAAARRGTPCPRSRSARSAGRSRYAAARRGW